MWVLLDMITALDMIQVVKEIFRTHHVGAPHLYLLNESNSAIHSTECNMIDQRARTPEEVFVGGVATGCAANFIVCPTPI